MKRIFLLFALAGLSTAGFSQTKKIAHRSHSGKNSSFTINSIDNFGTTPEMEEAKKKRALEIAKADSAAKKAVADSLARIQSKQGNKTKTKKPDKITHKDSTTN